jgi:sugar lactone lactonase YvrE
VEARLYGAQTLAAAADGTIYFDDGPNGIRAITPDGRIDVAVPVHVAGPDLYYFTDLAVAPDGTLYVAQPDDNRIRKRSPDGRVSVFRKILEPAMLSVGPDGGLAALSDRSLGIRRARLVVFAPDGRIVRSGRVDTPNGWSLLSGLTVDAAGNLLVSRFEQVLRVDFGKFDRVNLTPVAGRSSGGYSGDGGPAKDAQLSTPLQLAAGPDGDVFIVDWGNLVIRRVTRDGIIDTVAGNGTEWEFGDGGPADGASFTCGEVAERPDGALYMVDHRNFRIAVIAVDGTIQTFLKGCGPLPPADGFLHPPDPCLGSPAGIDIAPDGTLYVADIGESVVRKVTPDGVVSIIAGNASEADFEDGALATETSLNQAEHVAVAADGSVYVSQDNSTVVGRITPDGIITAVLGTAGRGVPEEGAVARDAPFETGPVLKAIGDRLLVSGLNGVYEIRPDGTIWRVAGGAYGFGGDGGAANASQMTPFGIAVDAAGDLFIADLLNARVRRVRAGIIETVAGTGLQTVSPASVGSPQTLSLAANGTLLLCDGANRRLLRLDPGKPGALCAGDCDDDGRVTVGELIRAVDIASTGRVNDCESYGGDHDRLGIADLMRAVDSVLRGCDHDLSIAHSQASKLAADP